MVHLEAGLRTGNPYSPYPEEINRRLTTRLATLHLAPTSTSKANLLTENVDETSIVVTGNTVIDARTSQGCRDANGKSFYADHPPVIEGSPAYPGSVHPHCRCFAGPPRRGAPVLP